MEPDRHPEDAAEFDMGFHISLLRPQKAQKEQNVFKKCFAPASCRDPVWTAFL
jgi:hypothetical protein